MKLDKIVSEEVSGSAAKSYVAEITRYHRIQASTMFHDAAEFVGTELKKMGLRDAKIEKFTADGKHTYWTYTSPVGWEVRSAELALVEPEKTLLVTFKDCPQSLHTFSKGTAEDGVVAELVDVGSGMDEKEYKGKKVGGKFVLATGRASIVQEEAVYKRGAAGVITDGMPYEFPKVRESIDIPDAHAYQGIWPKANDLKKLAFGFSLSKRQGNELRKLLKSGKVVKLKAVVDARLFPSHEEVVTATIKGSELPSEEVFVIAHLCHPKPGANDNASGCGAVLEVARTITSLLRSGRIDRPRRTIRFLFVPETLGTVAYLASHEDIPERYVAGINLDMVGEDQDRCGSTLGMTRTPDSLPSFLNDFMVDVYERSLKALDPLVAIGLAPKFRFATSTFSAGSDHAEFTTSTTKVPCVSFTQWPDKYYHTSMDTIENVSEDSLRRIAFVASLGALELANMSPMDVTRMIALTATGGSERLKKAASATVREMYDSADSAKNGRKIAAGELLRIAEEGAVRIAHIRRREEQAVASAERLGRNSITSAIVSKCQAELKDASEQETSKLDIVLRLLADEKKLVLPERVPESKAEKELNRVVPVRLFKGTLSADLIRERLGNKEYRSFSDIGTKDREFGNKMVEAMNFIDGERSGTDILRAVSSEYDRTDPEELLKVLKVLSRADLIRFR